LISSTGSDLLPFGKMFAFLFSSMGRRLRYMKKPNTTFEVTSRAIQGRLLLRPSKELNQIIRVSLTNSMAPLAGLNELKVLMRHCTKTRQRSRMTTLEMLEAGLDPRLDFGQTGG
jgi:hypothetical protein